MPLRGSGAQVLRADRPLGSVPNLPPLTPFGVTDFVGNSSFWVFPSTPRCNGSITEGRKCCIYGGSVFLAGRLFLEAVLLYLNAVKSNWEQPCFSEADGTEET